MSAQHKAVLFPSVGATPIVESRPTPTPGPTEILIDVKSIALNPIDYYMRDFGMFIAQWPAIAGSDISGTVLAVGSSVPAAAPKPGARVVAAAPSFFRQGDPDYGAFQEKVLVPWVAVGEIPDTMSFEEASVFPMALGTAWSGWYTIGVPNDTKYKPEDKQAVLIWGAASSVGTMAVQTAKSMGFKVYATASEKHHDWVKKIGVDRVFEYKNEDVVERIVDAVKQDGVNMGIGYDAVGATKQCQEILKALNGDKGARLASATVLNEQSPKTEGVETKFVIPPPDEKIRRDNYRFIYNEWLTANLASGDLVSAPPVRIVDGGLDGLNKGLDILKGGVSGLKIVLNV